MRNSLPEKNVKLARDIMTKRVQTLLPVTQVPEAMHQLLTKQFSEMPIVNECGKYCGMFSEKCCMRILSTLVELIDVHQRHPLRAIDVMVPRKSLFTVAPDDDVFTGMSALLKKRYSGAPVIDSNGSFLGVFSERTCLEFIIEAAYSGLPSAKVRQFIDPNSNRLIDADTDLHAIARIFVETSYGRLPVMQNGTIVGQISRRDVLRHSGILSSIMKSHLNDSEIRIDLPASTITTFVKAHDALPERTVSAFADDDSQTISPEMNLFSVAQLFFESPHRRFPVLENEHLIGQVSRCDVLRAAIKLLNQP